MSDKEKLRRLIEQGHDYYYSDAYNGASVYERWIWRIKHDT